MHALWPGDAPCSPSAAVLLAVLPPIPKRRLPAWPAAVPAPHCCESSPSPVGWAVLQKEVLHKPEPYYTVGAIGLSSVAFGLQVGRGSTTRPSTSNQRAGGAQMSFGILSIPMQSALSRYMKAAAAVPHL